MTNRTQTPTNHSATNGRDTHTMDTAAIYRADRARARIRELEAEAAGARLAAIAQPTPTRFTGIRTRIAAVLDRRPAVASIAASAERTLAGHDLNATPGDGHRKAGAGCSAACESAGSRAA